jgi:phosphopentomutase
MKKCILIVIDSLGVGAAPDAAKYGDENTNTFGNVSKIIGKLNLPTFNKLGFGDITEINGLDPNKYIATVGKLAEKSKGNDSTTGHWEIAGLISEKEFNIFPEGFPEEIVDRVSKATGYEFIGNFHASGTEIINNLGEEHIASKKLILYTSGDSVFQIAAHEDVIGLKTLYEVCKAARIVCNDYNIGRVIARPFKGTPNNFKRTYDRKDFGITPPGETLLSYLNKNKFKILGIGKISDLFGEKYLDNSIHTEGDKDGLDTLINSYSEGLYDFYFINLVDLDMLYGHREDPKGYYEGLKIIDDNLEKLLQVIDDEDLLILTGDHGTDPTDGKTDHSREYVPLVAYKNNIVGNNIGERNTFSVIASTISEFFELENIFYGDSFLEEINKK